MAPKSDEMAKILGLGRHKKRSWRWLAVAVVVAFGVAIWAFVPFTGSAQKTTYVTETVGRADIKVTVSATGTVEPTDFVEISSELSGTITKVHVDFNDAVEEGTVLAGLDTAKLEAQLAVQKASLASAEAKVAVAEATVKEARAEYERGEQLAQRGVETQQAFIAQEAVYERAQAELLSAIASRDLAKANVDLAQVDLSKACICSPVKGVVLDRDVDEGQIVAASLSAPVLFTIAEDLTRMELQVDIDEADIGRVSVGQPATFTVEAYDDQEFPAEITELRLASETVDGVVTYKGILTLDNGDMLLRPGMTATADIIVASVENALVVPNAALRYVPAQVVEEKKSSGSGLVGMIMPSGPSDKTARDDATTLKSVWVLRNDVAVEIPVEAGETDGSSTVILSGDLSEGDQVITDRFDAK
ncbi:efflux RND transporter periplasmic adaptor subunit [Thalassovita sp.]|uniref:efflux RND transporter periplasmic adaptor subunit n=1 Tax=Thalassovita sp. TaxID=1979401 RepID=UPI002B26D2A0|nr:efflux RND transporter periplasmic adaptor subunit [Thalassovita sp.]